MSKRGGEKKNGHQEFYWYLIRPLYCRTLSLVDRSYRTPEIRSRIFVLQEVWNGSQFTGVPCFWSRPTKNPRESTWRSLRIRQLWGKRGPSKELGTPWPSVFLSGCKRERRYTCIIWAEYVWYRTLTQDRVIWVHNRCNFSSYRIHLRELRIRTIKWITTRDDTKCVTLIKEPWPIITCTKSLPPIVSRSIP